MSCNLLNIKLGFGGSSTLSEISSINSEHESGFSDSRDELKNLVTSLGLSRVEDLYQDRFRVDRKKLEHMILGDNEAPEPADTFFHKIMEETNTFVTWPSRLKIGAKSKKDLLSTLCLDYVKKKVVEKELSLEDVLKSLLLDPHIRIAGRPEDVKTAKEKILLYLDTRSNRVTMKMDVSYTDHSHIIGKGGQSIKRVMDETQCHIHFPDSNRSNPNEKSNQVSIAGDIAGVERARARVRNLTPLIFSFELPILSRQCTPPEPSSPYVMHISQQYNVQVMFRTRPKLHSTLVLVKGAEWEVSQVKEATMLLIKFMCDDVANQTLIQMTMEISPVHHPMVVGKGSINLKSIMSQTKTQIIFFDANDPNIPTIKKSNVTITGMIHNVYLARQQLMGSLPLVLMFDLPEHLSNVSSERITQLTSALDVFINIRHKPKQNTLSVIIKGIERNASNIYEARHQLLNLNEPRILAEIPPTYYFPSNDISSTENVTAIQPPPPPVSVMQTAQSPTIVSPVPIPSFAIPPQYPIFNMYSQPFLVPNPQTGPNSAGNASGSSSGYSSGSFNRMFTSSGSSNDSSSKENSHASMTSSAGSSPVSNNTLGNRRSPSNSMDKNIGLDLSSMLDIKLNKNPLFQPSSLSTLDYDQRRLAAMQVLQKDPVGYRVPTNYWSGYGFSATSPATTTARKQTNDGLHSSVPEKHDNDPWTPTTKTDTNQSFSTAFSDFSLASASGVSRLNTSNIVDHTPTHSLKRLTNTSWKDLSSLLTSLNLEKYIRTFNSHEVDLGLFSILTDRDLIEIGINAFGARRKMLIAIAELSKRSSPFSGSAAPGAERKSSSSSPQSNQSSNDKGW